jgi:hypothetical protein
MENNNFWTVQQFRLMLFAQFDYLHDTITAANAAFASNHGIFLVWALTDVKFNLIMREVKLRVLPRRTTRKWRLTK